MMRDVGSVPSKSGGWVTSGRSWSEWVLRRGGPPVWGRSSPPSTLSLTDPASGLGYITAYTLGFAIPFFVMAFFLGRTRWILKYSNRLMKAGGALMVVFGILLYFDQMTVIIAWLTKMTGGFTGF